MIYKDLSCIIKNSKHITYKFNLDSSNNLIVENYNESTGKNTRFIYKQFVLDYSVDIDNKDKIHIAFTTKDGLLKHSILDFPDIEKNISRVPSKDYRIDYITIKTISSDIHVFYMLQNKYNINRWTINHSFFHNNTWITKRLGETSYTKSSVPYSIDSYKNNIYIFYSSNTPNQYCIQKFNIPFSLWSIVEDNISLIHCKNVELFINPLGIGTICYNSCINKNINTFLKFKDFNSSSSIWSDDLLIKNNIFDFSLPSIICNNDALFLFWKENDNLFLIKSFYDINNLPEKKLISYKGMIISCKYITNETSRDIKKNNFLFLTSITPLSTILDDSDIQNLLKVDSTRIDQKFNPLNGPLKETLKIIAQNSNLGNKSISNNQEGTSDEKNENTNNLSDEPKGLADDKFSQIAPLLNTLNLKENEIKQLKNTLNLKDVEIEKFKNTIITNEKEIENFKNDLKLKENDLQELKINFNSQQEGMKNLKNSLSIKYAEIENLKNNLNSKDLEIENLNNTFNSNKIEFESLNKSYSSLRNLIDEKNLLIQELYYKIQELESQNIKDMQTQKKKSFIDLFKKDQ